VVDEKLFERNVWFEIRISTDATFQLCGETYIFAVHFLNSSYLNLTPTEVLVFYTPPQIMLSLLCVYKGVFPFCHIIEASG
jgi:hypothetical protein